MYSKTSGNKTSSLKKMRKKHEKLAFVPPLQLLFIISILGFVGADKSEKLLPDEKNLEIFF